MKSGLTFLIAARECEIVELDQLSRTSSLVSLLGHLIHVLQKERGRSNMYLSSGGKRGHTNLVDQINECLQIELEARTAFDHLDTGNSSLGNGARLFGRIAYVLQGLDALPRLRERIAGLEISPDESTASFVRLISGLLAVVFEAADTATHPEISRLLVATFNFMQGKEFAGQERATGVAAFASGAADAPGTQHWLDLIDSQERCFQIFIEFSPPSPLASWLPAPAARPWPSWKTASCRPHRSARNPARPGAERRLVRLLHCADGRDASGRSAACSEPAQTV